MTAEPLEPTFSTTLSYDAYLPVTFATTASDTVLARERDTAGATRTIDREAAADDRAASRLSARHTGEVTMPVALSFLAFW